MEVSILKDTITQISRLHQLLDLYINSYGYPSDLHDKEIRILIERLDLRSAEIIGEVTVNYATGAERLDEYLNQLLLILKTQRLHPDKFYEAPYEEVNNDPEFEDLMQWYSYASDRFVTNVFDVVRPIAETYKPTKGEEIQLPVELFYSISDHKSARLIYFKYSGMLTAVMEHQKKELGHINMSSIAKMIAPLLDIAPDYIEGLLGHLENVNLNNRKNTPYTLNAVKKALHSLSEVDIAAPDLVKIHDQLSKIERKAREQKK